jgi:hypothetical protein
MALRIWVTPPVYGAVKAASDELRTLWAGEVSFPHLSGLNRYLMKS